MLKLFTATVSLISLTALISSCNPNQANTSGGTMSTTDSPQIQSSMHGNHDKMMHHSKNGKENSDHGMNHTMDLGPADEEYDLRFIDAMIPHHEGALVMAEAVLSNSSRDELKALAKEIIEAQKQEITEMQEWRKAWYPSAPSKPIAWHSGMNHSMPMTEVQISAMGMDMDLGEADDEFDLRFIDAMIPHHEAAVTMAQDMLNKSQREEMQKLANDIINSQQAEINQLKSWRQEWYGK